MSGVLYFCISLSYNLKHTTMKTEIYFESKINPKFEKVRTFLTKVPNIGNGGCGVSAIAMYRWLKANGFPVTDVRFVMGYNMRSSFRNNSRAQINMEPLPNACSHVGIIIQTRENDMIIDCEKRWYFSTYNNTQVISENELIGSLENLGEWNCDFDRNKEIPRIEKELNIDLSDIKM